MGGEGLRGASVENNSMDGRMAVQSKNASASVVANGAAPQVCSRYSAAEDAALPASFQPENAKTMTGSCAERRSYQSKCVFCDPPRCSVTCSDYL